MKDWKEYKAALKEHIRLWNLEWKINHDIENNLVTVMDRGGSIEVYFDEHAIPLMEEE